MMILDEALIAKLTRKKRTTLWSVPCAHQPYFVRAALGDGNRLAAITPLNTRPNYYLIRVDSTWSLKWREDVECLANHIDEICEAIEDEVGRKYEFDEDRGEDTHQPWPNLDDEAGVAWSDAMDLVPHVRINTWNLMAELRYRLSTGLWEVA